MTSTAKSRDGDLKAEAGVVPAVDDEGAILSDKQGSNQRDGLGMGNSALAGSWGIWGGEGERVWVQTADADQGLS